jgi:anti-sigma factor RsiW
VTDLQHPDNLSAFVDGLLNEAEAEVVISHLGECDLCLEAVDQLWLSRSTQPGEMDSLPSLDPALVQRLEEQLLRRIRRSDLAARAVWLGTSGLVDTYLTMLPPFVNTCLVLLRPIFGLGQPSNFFKEADDD